jgi:hypothetical protein
MSNDKTRESAAVYHRPDGKLMGARALRAAQRLVELGGAEREKEAVMRSGTGLRTELLLQ